jgi:transposase
MFVPPYSPFLNLIEEFWSKVKSSIKRYALEADDNLTDRIITSIRNMASLVALNVAKIKLTFDDHY